MKLHHLLITLCVFAIQSLQAEVKPAAIFSSHMVLQRNLPVQVWGKADAGEKVTVTLGADAQSTHADSEGKWSVKLSPVAAGDNMTLKVEGSVTANPVIYQDVAIGEVWICSGQSNMEWPTERSVNGEQELAAADYPKIRLFKVAKNTPDAPVENVSGEWVLCAPETVKGFTAVGYFFGRELFRNLNVPIGLIDTSWGGTPAESWIRMSVLEKEADYAKILERRASILKEYATPDKLNKSLERWEKRKIEWEASVAKLLASPVVIHPELWKQDANLDGWKAAKLPETVETIFAKNYDGITVFRKVIDVPASVTGEEVTLSLGVIDDYDSTWINGKLIGKMDTQNKSAWTTPRTYTIPAGTLKEGKNIIVIRLIDVGGSGGFTGVDDELFLTSKSGWKSSLADEWQCKIETDIGPTPSKPYSSKQNAASTLYDGMIAPLVPYGIKGAIWYQGESNASRAKQYQKLLPALIRNWREDWKQGNFSFYIVQLANYRKPVTEPQENEWAELREAQLMTSLTVPNTGMATIIDIGSAKTIHPTNKQDVGKRLALLALAKDYGFTEPAGWLGKLPVVGKYFTKPITHSGPIYKSSKVSGSTIELKFDHVGKGLVAKGNGKLKYFSIAGEDKKFVWADAKIVGEKVVVSSPDVPKPVAVRYDWADNPDGNLYNVDGLPASPFRTDNWPGKTEKNL